MCPLYAIKSIINYTRGMGLLNKVFQVQATLKGLAGKAFPSNVLMANSFHLRKTWWYSKNVLVAFEDRIVVFNLSASPWIGPSGRAS